MSDHSVIYEDERGDKVVRWLGEGGQACGLDASSSEPSSTAGAKSEWPATFGALDLWTHRQVFHNPSLVT